MPEVSYESIEGLIESAEQDGTVMRCVFRCPVSDTRIETTAGIQSGRGLGAVAKKAAKRGLLYRLRWGVRSAVRSALGYGIAGRIAGDVASEMTSSAGSRVEHSYSEDEKKAAVLAAFQGVQGQFAHDPKRGWMAAAAAGDVLTDFAVQLQRAPVQQKYDKGLLARMLVEVAGADGRLAGDEKAFLQEFIPPELGSVEELAERPPLSKAELAEAGRGPVRETMLMIAWGLACIDRELAAAEAQRLAELAEGLEIPAARAEELKRYAQRYVIDQGLEEAYPDGKPDEAGRAEVMRFAEQIGLPAEEAERVEIRYRKRNGLI